MKLATFLSPGAAVAGAGAVQDGRVYAFAPEHRVVDVLSGRPAEISDESWSLDEVTLLAPVPEPGTIYAIGLNYEKHIAESRRLMASQAEVIVFISGSM